MSNGSPVEQLAIHDIEKFVGLVEARPALYTRSLKENTDVNVKRKLWHEICAELVSNWGDLSADSKSKFGQDAQQKWLNLRTCFSRELKAQRNVKWVQGPRKRRKYMYFEKMMFLLPTIEQKPTEGHVQEGGNEDTENPDPEEVWDDEIPSRPSTSTYRNRTAQRKRSADMSSFEVGVLNPLPREPDEDTHFALSLVPQLRSLSEEEKFDAKIEILSILKQIKRKRGLNVAPICVPQPPFQYTSATAPNRLCSFMQPNIAPSKVQHHNTVQHPYRTPASPVNTENTAQSYGSNFTDESSL